MTDTIQSLVALVSNPLFWKVLVGYWIFSALIGPLPRPTEQSSQLYRYLFGVLHSIAGNINRAALAFKLPGAQEQNTDGHI
jgi:hypothetical protein